MRKVLFEDPDYNTINVKECNFYTSDFGIIVDDCRFIMVECEEGYSLLNLDTFQVLPLVIDCKDNTTGFLKSVVERLPGAEVFEFYCKDELYVWARNK